MIETNNIIDKSAIVTKWLPILEYSSQLVKPLPIEKYDYVAGQLETYSSLFDKYPRFLQSFIPQVRVLDGDITYLFEMINGYIHVVIVDGNHDGLKVDIAMKLDPEHYTWGYTYKGYYIKENGNWKYV